MSKLHCGAREVARITGRDGRQWVLAHDSGAYMPWITWEVDQSGACYWGHYFKTRDAAAEDLLDRVIL